MPHSSQTLSSYYPTIEGIYTVCIKKLRNRKIIHFCSRNASALPWIGLKQKWSILTTFVFLLFIIPSSKMVNSNRVGWDMNSIFEKLISPKNVFESKLCCRPWCPPHKLNYSLWSSRWTYKYNKYDTSRAVPGALAHRRQNGCLGGPKLPTWSRKWFYRIFACSNPLSLNKFFNLSTPSIWNKDEGGKAKKGGKGWERRK